MVAPKKTKGKHKRQFDTQIDVACILDGQLRTMHDDGIQRTGEAKPGRQALLMKLEALDDDGDPVFFFPGDVPAKSIAIDDGARQGSRVGVSAKSGSDPSKNKDYKTLRKKWEAAGTARLAHMAEHKAEYSLYGPTVALPPPIAAVASSLGRAGAAADDARAAGAVK